MELRNGTQRYGAVALGLHWLSAACVAGAWILGQTIDEFPKAWEPQVKLVHVWTGLAVIALLAARLVWRFADMRPEPVASRFDPWLARAASAGHVALYALLLAAPVAGIVLSFARGEAVSVFGFYDIASPWARDRAFARSVKEVHEALANAILLLAAFHAAAALAHHYLLKDDTLRRMLPRSRA